jgi:hypothetical protein
MQFPEQILPQRSYKFIRTDLSEHFLARFVPVDAGISLIDLETGQIQQAFICQPREQVFDLSTSLLGIFEIGFLAISLTETGKAIFNHYCEPDAETPSPVPGKDFEWIKRPFWTVQVGKIHGKEADYRYNDSPFKATCHVQHTPMRWNYWHFSVRWQTEEDMIHELPESERKKKWANRLAHEARSLIAQFARMDVPVYPPLNTWIYSEL